MSDLDDIRCGRSVNNRVTEGANKVLYVTHPYIGGLETPLFVQLDNRFKKQPGEFVQKINTRDQHWVTITNVGCETGEVLLCDSLYGFYNQQYPVRCLKAVDSIACSVHTISALNLQQQSPGTLCGLFAIAFATSLCDGKDPSYIIYDEQNLCQELESHPDNLSLENYGFSVNTIRSPRILFEIQVTPEMLIDENPLKRKGEAATSSAAAKRQRLQQAKELDAQYCKKEMEHYQVYLEKSKNDPFYPDANAIYTFIKQNTNLNLPPADTKLILSNDLDFLDTLVRFHAEFQGLAIVDSKFEERFSVVILYTHLIKTRDELFATLIHEFAHGSVGQQGLFPRKARTTFQKCRFSFVESYKREKSSFASRIPTDQTRHGHFQS